MIIDGRLNVSECLWSFARRYIFPLSFEKETLKKWRHGDNCDENYDVNAPSRAK